MQYRVLARPLERAHAEGLEGRLGQKDVLRQALGERAINEPAEVYLVPEVAHTLMETQDLYTTLILRGYLEARMHEGPLQKEEPLIERVGVFRKEPARAVERRECLRKFLVCLKVTVQGALDERHPAVDLRPCHEAGEPLHPYGKRGRLPRRERRQRRKEIIELLREDVLSRFAKGMSAHCRDQPVFPAAQACFPHESVQRRTGGRGLAEFQER